MKNADAKVCRTNHLALEAVHVGVSDVLVHAQKKGQFAPLMKVAKNVKSFFQRFSFFVTTVLAVTRLKQIQIGHHADGFAKKPNEKEIFNQ